jgi:hypothetical protein
MSPDLLVSILLLGFSLAASSLGSTKYRRFKAEDEEFLKAKPAKSLTQLGLSESLQRHSRYHSVWLGPRTFLYSLILGVFSKAIGFYFFAGVLAGWAAASPRLQLYIEASFTSFIRRLRRRGRSR